MDACGINDRLVGDSRADFTRNQNLRKSILRVRCGSLRVLIDAHSGNTISPLTAEKHNLPTEWYIRGIYIFRCRRKMRIMREEPMSDAQPESIEQVARQAVELLRARLPHAWNVNSVKETTDSKSHPDFLVRVKDSRGEESLVVIEAKRIVEKRDISRIQEQIESYLRELGAGSTGLLAAKYLSPQVRAELEERDISYIDATGNMRITLASPALYIGDRGADSDPWRGAGRPRGTLKGDPAARIVRTLLDSSRPWKISDLTKAAGTSVGATYRVVDYLESENLISRAERSGGLVVADWIRLLRAWSLDYNALTANRVLQYIEPRGITALLSKASETSIFPYAVTSSVAAAEWAPYAPTRSAFIYVSNIEQAEREWNLRRTDGTPNVLLLEPKSPRDIVFANTSRRRDGLTLAATTQVAADLMNGPGRNPAEAEELITWMSNNEGEWRK